MKRYSHALFRRPALLGLAVLALLTAFLAPLLTQVGLMPAEATPARRTATATTTVGSQFGGFSPDGNFLWLSDADLARNLDLMKASGASWVRLGIVWSVVEQTRGTFDWSTSDRVIAAANARGLHVLALITYAPSWASGSGDDKVAPRDPADISGVARAAAARYAPQGVHAWEVWNEPNISAAFAPRPDLAKYVGILKATSSAIRGVDPGATIVTGGLSPAGDAADGSTVSPLTFVQQLYALGAGSSFTAVGMHPYAFPALPMQPGTADWNSFQRSALLRQVMVDHGDSAKKMWFTEFGAPTGTSSDAVSSDLQAQGIQQAYDQLSIWGWAGPLFYYSLRDGGTDPNNREDNFGLVRTDYSAKPALAAFAAEMAKPLAATTTTTTTTTTYVSSLTPTAATNGYGPVERDRSNGESGALDGRPLTIRGRTYARGLGVHAGSSVSYDLGAAYTTFTSAVGVDDEVTGHGTVVFRVLADGVVVWSSPVLTGASPVQVVKVPVAGVRTLRLVVEDSGDGSAYDHADWAGARLVTVRTAASLS